MKKKVTNNKIFQINLIHLYLRVYLSFYEHPICNQVVQIPGCMVKTAQQHVLTNAWAVCVMQRMEHVWTVLQDSKGNVVMKVKDNLLRVIVDFFNYEGECPKCFSRKKKANFSPHFPKKEPRNNNNILQTFNLEWNSILF